MKNIFNMARTIVATLTLALMSTVFTACGQDYEETVRELAAPITNTVHDSIRVAVPVNVTQLVNNYSWFTNQVLYINGYKAMDFDVQNMFAAIEMPEAEQHMPAETKDTASPWHWDDSQVSTAEVNTYGNDSLAVEAWISPLYEKWEPIRLHQKVLKINAVYQMSGFFNLSNRGMVEFSQELTRPWYQVDSSVRVDTVKTTETQIEYIFSEVHDTTTVEILRETFIQGADIKTNVSNNLGYAQLTIDLGNERLLDLIITHRDNPEVVENFGTSLASVAQATKWDWTSGQYTTSSYSSQNCKITSMTMQAPEMKEIEGVGNLITTPVLVEGYYVNDGGETKTFSVIVSPLWLQTLKPNNNIVTPDIVEYRAIARKLTVDGAKLTTKPILQQRVNSGAWEDIQNFKKVNVGLSGKPEGLDIYVESTVVEEQHQDAYLYTGTDETWIGGVNEEGVKVERETMINEFDWRFKAHAKAGGLVGPRTQLYVMRALAIQVPAPDGNMYTVTWEDGTPFTLSSSVKLNDTRFEVDPAYEGQTKTMGGTLYKYEKSFVQSFTATVGGKELASTESRSQLWLPVVE